MTNKYLIEVGAARDGVAFAPRQVDDFFRLGEKHQVSIGRIEDFGVRPFF